MDTTVAVTAPALPADRLDDARRIIGELSPLEGAALPILHALQHEFGYIPRECDAMLADALNLSLAEVVGTVSFYHDFRRAPAGRHVLKLCRAEACQAVGGVTLATGLLRRLNLEWGGTSRDGVTVEPTFCLGLCSSGPAALLNDEPHAMLDDDSLATILQEADAA